MSTPAVTTSQYFTSREFVAATPSDRPAALGAAQDFAEQAGNQVGEVFPVSASACGETVSVDLERWPEGVAFGRWFPNLMKRRSVTVID